MGLLGSLLKVAKAGLGIVTGGISDKAISAAKSFYKVMGGPKSKTTQHQAFLNKYIPLDMPLPAARVVGQRTEARTLAERVPAAARRFERYAPEELDRPDEEYAAPRRRKRRAAQATPPRPAARRSAARGQRRTKRRRGGRLPGGGLDLKAMSVAWRGAGKPGSWMDWIRGNPIRRPR